MDTTIANDALRLAMEWGEHFMKPTQPRLKALHPALSAAQLDEYDAAARAAMTCANGYLYDRPDSAYEPFAAAVRRDFAWVSEKNLAGLYSQGMYFAHK